MGVRELWGSGVGGAVGWDWGSCGGVGVRELWGSGSEGVVLCCVMCALLLAMSKATCSGDYSTGFRITSALRLS